MAVIRLRLNQPTRCSKRKSKAGAVRVEANLPWISAAYANFFDLENEDQGHGVHQSQWADSMANVNL